MVQMVDANSAATEEIQPALVILRSKITLLARRPDHIVRPRLLAGELSQREIGRELYLSVNTVKSHTRAIYTKLDVASRPAAVDRARALRVIA